MDKTTKEEFYALFDPEVHAALDGAIEKFEAPFLVCYENQDMSSSALGHRTAMPVGPNNTLKTLAETDGHYLNDLPSQREYPVKYMETQFYDPPENKTDT